MIRVLAIPLIFIGLIACSSERPGESDRGPSDNATAGQVSESHVPVASVSDGDVDELVSEAGARNSDNSSNAGKPGTTSNPTVAASTSNEPPPASPSVTRRGSTGDDVEYDPNRFGKLLAANVKEGRVDYAAFRNVPSFDAHVTSIETADLGGMATDERLAFWVNAYNALVIRNVLDHPGTKNPLDVPGFFDEITFRVAGRDLTLNQIENEVIRPTFDEPLIHFGLVCAARSCPPLIPTLYTGANVRSLLAENARKYLADSRQNRISSDGTRLSLSKIFEWYIVDFGNDHDGLRSFVAEYGTPAMKKALENGTPTVDFIEYDWTINAM